MSDETEYEKELQKVYEQYKRNEISAEEIPPGMLFTINRMLEEELSEKESIVSELEKMLYGATFVDKNKRPHFP